MFRIIKIFCASDAEKLEEKVNAWLLENTEVDIYHRQLAINTALYHNLVVYNYVIEFSYRESDNIYGKI